MGEKTEKASPKKLRDAKRKGQVAKAEDLPTAFTFVFSCAITLGMAQYLYGKFSSFLINTFKMIPQPDLAESIAGVFFDSLIVIFMASIPVLVGVTLIGVLVKFLATGPVFAPEVFKFDIKKFNPVENLKQKFKMKTLVELLKSVAKLTIAGYIIYLVMYKSLPILIQTVSVPITAALAVFHTFLVEVIVKVGLFFIIIAVADFIYQKKNFAKEMKMEKFEVKQEYKNTEGDPHIKGKRRQLAQEIAYQDGPTGGIRRAKAVVTNPTHLAVALAYDSELDPAPYIVGMGDGTLAERMIKIAERYNIPILRNVDLAHKLWDNGEIYEYVPEDTYEAIAEVLQWVASLTNPQPGA
jgi:type III secretion protein U